MIIKFSNVTKKINDVTILNNLNLEIKPKELLCIIGNLVVVNLQF